MNFKKTVIVISLIVLLLVGCSKKKNEESKANKVVKKINSGTQMALKQIDNIKEQSEKQLNIIKNASKKKINNLDKAAQETKEELWGKYNKTKESINIAKAQKKYKELVELLKKEAKISEKLERKDIQAWQLNNVGYYSIEDFKNKTHYEERMRQLSQIKDSKKRKEYYRETLVLIKKYKKILDDSYPYLIKAKEIDAEAPDKKRKKVIANNILFVNDIKELLNKARSDEE